MSTQCTMTWLDTWWGRFRPLAAGAWPSARFPEPQEGEWLRKFTADQAGLDAAVSLQTLLFPSLVARLVSARAHSVQLRGRACDVLQFGTLRRPSVPPSCRRRRRGAGVPRPHPPHRPFPPRLPQLWDQARSGDAGDGLSAVDGLWLAGFLAWAPLLLWLSLRRPKAYLRLRVPLVLLSRLHRSLTCECEGRALECSTGAACMHWPQRDDGCSHRALAGAVLRPCHGAAPLIGDSPVG